jgi:hypothetical protein
MSTSNKSTVAVTVEKVVVEEMPDHAELEAKQVKAAADVVESNTRAGYVAGLKTEYGEKPANAAREAAVPDGAPKPPAAVKKTAAASDEK